MAPVKCVLLDIEGTICPISFVKDTLFPYALKALPDVLASKWDDEGFRPYRDAFPENVRATAQELQAHVEDLTKRDVKIAYHKNLQGYLWENGYKTGAYSTPLFPDVAPWLKQWKDDGIQLAIYSSGSVFAQKLLFGHVKSSSSGVGQKRKRPNGDDVARPNKQLVEEGAPAADSIVKPSVADEASEIAVREVDGVENQSPNGVAGDVADTDTEDLQHLITDWFDTTNAGLKQDASSYEAIARTLKLRPRDIHFLSDNVKEVDAAIESGMESTMVDRPGNAPLSTADRNRLRVVNSLDAVKLDVSDQTAKGRKNAHQHAKPDRRRSQRLKDKEA